MAKYINGVRSVTITLAFIFCIKLVKLVELFEIDVV